MLPPIECVMQKMNPERLARIRAKQERDRERIRRGDIRVSKKSREIMEQLSVKWASVLQALADR